MFRSINKRASSSAHGGNFIGTCVRFNCLRQLAKFAGASAFLWVAATSFAVTANAVEANVQDDAFSALRQYVQLIDTGRADAGQTSNQPKQEPADATYAALRAFTKQIDIERPAPIAGLPKLAEADNLLDFLRGGGSSAAPSAAPKGSTNANGPVAGGTKPSTPVEATYV
ncbi:MAG: hypothetical protein WB499_15110, partial [Pseudolabrys sp.]